MLGQLYRPRGLALETAQAVLQVEDPWACNVAAGCSNGCSYCYLDKAMRCSRETALKVRHPKKAPAVLVENQLWKMEQRGDPMPEGVFLSFLTDPFLPENRAHTEYLIVTLTVGYGIPVATSSKLGLSTFPDVKHGMTIVSLDPHFWKTYEPKTLDPVERLNALLEKSDTWVSMEPYPVSAIWSQDIDVLLNAFAEANVKLIIFGKWNYEPKARTRQARAEYAQYIRKVTWFSQMIGIRCHIKSDTRKFALSEN